MRPRFVEVAAADLELGAVDECLMRPVGSVGAERGDADAVGVVPLADRDQGLDLVGDERDLLDPVAPGGRPPPPPAGPTPRTSQHRQHVGEKDVRSVQILWNAALLGELQSQPELRKALVTAAEVGEVYSEHRERPKLGPARADRTGELERLLAGRTRLLVAPGQHQGVSERRQHLRALRRGRLGGTSSTARSKAARPASRLPAASR